MGGNGTMRAFIDTNVVVDFLGKREPFFNDAAILFELGKLGKIDLVVSSLTIVNCAYILKKQFSNAVMLDKIEDFCRMLKISPIDKSVILKAILQKPIDFEDAVQYFSAKSFNMDIIITRDKKGFSVVEIPIMTPAEFIEACRK